MSVWIRVRWRILSGVLGGFSVNTHTLLLTDTDFQSPPLSPFSAVNTAPWWRKNCSLHRQIAFYQCYLYRLIIRAVTNLSELTFVSFPSTCCWSLRGQEIIRGHAGKATERRGCQKAVRAFRQHRRVYCVERT